MSGSVAAMAVAVGTGRVAAASDVSPLGCGAQASRVRLARPESGRQRGHLPCGALGEGLPASPSSQGPGVSGSGPCSPPSLSPTSGSSPPCHVPPCFPLTMTRGVTSRAHLPNHENLSFSGLFFLLSLVYGNAPFQLFCPLITNI